MMAWILKLAGVELLKRMAKKLFIAYLLPSMFDATMQGLANLSQRTDSQIDDELVRAVVADREKLLDEIKAELS